MEKEIAIADIRIDGGTQHRELDEDVMKQYKAMIPEADPPFPPVEVMFDGKDYWLIDGFHRYHCHRKLGKKYIKADVTEGSKRDAQFKSLSANSVHGQPRAPGVAKEIILKILADKEWGMASDTEIAMAVGGVTRQYVNKVRKEFKTPESATSCTSGQSKSTKKKKTTKKQDSEATNEDSEPEEEKNELPKFDSVKQEIPEHLREVFTRKSEIKEHVKHLNAIMKAARDGQAANDLLWANCKLESLKSEVGNVRRNLRFTLPYAICPYCMADFNNANCLACEGRGFVNEMTYMATPPELKRK